MKILVTGGTGYIGSHTSVLLLKKGYDVVIADNLSNSSEKVIDKIEKITGKRPVFYKCDLTDKASCEKIFNEHKIDAVIHFAGLKAVGESCKIPMTYYYNNIASSTVLASVMAEHNCKKIIFSSSATVYGNPASVPINESFPLSTTNPYGSTKLMIEKIYSDLYEYDKEWNVTLLRYFNPIGADESGLIGDDPNGIPNNLMPYIVKVAAGLLPQLSVFGNDYPTYDGTGVRDYVHVSDLARGHICAIEKMTSPGVHIYNLGTGRGYSVLDIVKTFEKSTGVKVPYVIAPRRDGDIPECYADTEKAKRELDFVCELGLEDMCRSAWNFAKVNWNK